MAKKKPKAGNEEAVSDDGRISLQVRFDARLHRRLTETAEKLGISLNRLVSDMCMACASVMREGKLEKGTYGWYLKQEPGHLAFGREQDLIWPVSEEERIEAGLEGTDIRPEVKSMGLRWFNLNYSETANIHGAGEE